MKNIVILVFIVSLLNGCMFIGLSESIDRLDEAVTLAGSTDLPAKSPATGRAPSVGSALPIIVALVSAEGKSYDVQAYTVVYGNDPSLLIVPSGGLLSAGI